MYITLLLSFFPPLFRVYFEKLVDGWLLVDPIISFSVTVMVKPLGILFLFFISDITRELFSKASYPQLLAALTTYFYESSTLIYSLTNSQLYLEKRQCTLYFINIVINCTGSN